MSKKFSIDGDFERSNIDMQLSQIEEGPGGNLIVTLYPRRQTSGTWVMRWIEPCFRIRGVLGKTVTVHIQHYGKNGNDRNHQTWKENQRGHFSYDFRQWHKLDQLQIFEDHLTLTHNTPFTQDEVYIARSWPRSVSIVGENILAIKEEFPNLIEQTKTSKIFIPEKTKSFPAQEFIAAENASCIDEIHRTIPETPFYSFAINDKKFPLEQKRSALVMGGVHAGEDVGDLALWEFVRWLLSNEEEAVALRANYIIRVYPMVNAPGRYAGYWRSSPDSDTDTNRQWGFENPDNGCVRVARAVMDDELEGRLVWGLDFHAAPAGATLQLAIKQALPNSMAFYHKSNSFLTNQTFGIYGDEKTELKNEVPPTLTTSWMRILHQASLSITVESSDQSGPVSPDVVRPYAIAMCKAIHQMHTEGYMETPQ